MHDFNTDKLQSIRIISRPKLLHTEFRIHDPENDQRIEFERRLLSRGSFMLHGLWIFVQSADLSRGSLAESAGLSRMSLAESTHLDLRKNGPKSS